MIAIEEKFKQVIFYTVVQKNKDIVPPTFVLERSIQQIDEFSSLPLIANPIYLTIKDADIPNKEIYLKKTADTLTNHVYPSYQLLSKHLTDKLLPDSNDQAGYSKFDDGLKYYQYALQKHTTTNLTPDDVYTLGIKLVDEYQTRLRFEIEQAGITGESFPILMQALFNSEKFKLHDLSDSASLIKMYEQKVDKAESILDSHFSDISIPDVVIEPVPEYRALGSAKAYYMPRSLDGASPATFFINTVNIEEARSYDIATLVHHEAIPGHHLQISIQHSLKGLPRFRTLIPFTAYIEGWGLYAEQLAYEAGYTSSPEDKIGYLQLALLRAVRLVLDTGIHAKGWSREQAIDYMIENTGLDREHVVSEVDRYIVNPGQATAYMVGMREILKLREEYKSLKGSDYDIKAFHKLILENGAMPLNELKSLISE